MTRKSVCVLKKCVLRPTINVTINESLNCYSDLMHPCNLQDYIFMLPVLLHQQPKDIQFMTQNKEKQHILKIEMLDPESVRHLTFLADYLSVEKLIN